MTLVGIKCPSCGEFLFPKDGISKPASSYYDCLRSCEKYEVGFSNAKNNPTTIYKNYLENIPELLRNDVDISLINSLNKFNRKNKQTKFGFSTSEDALTWSFFKYFAVNNKLRDLLNLLNIKSEETEFDIYLWGTKITPFVSESNFIEKFIEISDSFNEAPAKRTEPDVIIKLPNKLIFIEVKYLSSNEIKTDKSKFTKYLISEIETKELVESGHYELFRNWVFASYLSNGQEFQLINLGPKKLFSDKNRDKLIGFEKSLKANNGQFIKIGWEEILEKINVTEYDIWFKNYLNEKLNSSH